jgi:hypothetical protein
MIESISFCNKDNTDDVLNFYLSDTKVVKIDICGMEPTVSIDNDDIKVIIEFLQKHLENSNN